MKKILSILMITMLSLTMVACGDNIQEKETADVETQTIEKQESAQGAGTPEVIDPETLSLNNDEDDSQKNYDFNLKISESFGMEKCVEKISNGKLSTAGNVLAERLQNSATELGLGDFVEVFNEYEEYEGESLDKLANVLALEEDDVDKAQIEAGMYHSSEGDCYHQYTSYISASFYDTSEKQIQEVINKIKKGYGVTLNSKKTKEAIETVFEKAKEIENDYSLVEVTTVKNSEYVEEITVSVDAGVMEDGTVCSYIYVDRDRVYQ